MSSILLSLFGCSAKFTAEKKDYFETCYHPETGGTSIPFKGPHGAEVFRPECSPDVLYSWQKENKINWKNFAVNPLRAGKYLYTWRTPLSTYAYGNVQIRLKLKKGIKFRWVIISNTSKFFCPARDQETTVYVLTTTYSKTVSEYLLCSPGVLESWSVHTPVSYLEAQREYEFILANHTSEPQKYDAFGFGNKRTRLPFFNKAKGADPYFVNWDSHVVKWGTKELENALESLKNPGDLPLAGTIFYADGVPPIPRRHYQTSVRSYFGLTDEQLEAAGF